MGLLRRTTISLLSLILAATSDYVYSGKNSDGDVSYIAYFFTALLPALYLFTFIAAVTPRPIDVDNLMVAGVVIVTLCVFGLGSYTDRTIGKHGEEIRSRAESLRNNPQKGKAWARARLFVLVVSALAACWVIGSIAIWRGV
jgi:exosortase/archaeosortase